MNIAEIGSRQTRALPASFVTRDEDGNRYLEGYWSVFNSIYEIAPGMTESIAPGAFDDTLSGDIRCLTDHDTRLVVGRTTAHTFEVRQDEHGLWGRVMINPKDQDAMNTVARVDRGDVNQASFGFDILDEEADYREDGSVHWTIKKVKLYECSVVTFPAYQETNISSRSKEMELHEKRKLEIRKMELRKKLERKADGTESTDAEEKD
jgi:HK97 family phage prohead protease